MRKHFLLLLLALVAGTSAIFAQTYSNVKIGDLYYDLGDYYEYWDNADQQYKFYSYYARVTSNPNKYSGKVVVPDTVEYNNQKYAVKEIYSNAFKDCSNLTAVELPLGIERINSSAFSNCGSLLSINIPEGVTRIEGGAFSHCNSLTSIDFPESLTYIGNASFQYCNGLTEIVIPDNVTIIEGCCAFYYCNNLRSATIGKGVTRIGSSTFDGCYNLEAVHISDLSAWCRIAFDDEYANPSWYAHHLYLNGEEITDLVIPDDITAIGQYTFMGCSNIQSVVIPDNVQSVETQAFRDCYGLKSVSLGANIANLNKDAFLYCNSLTTVNWNIKNFIDFASYTLSPFYNVRNNITSFTFGESVEHIPAFLCKEMSNLKRIDIPASVTSVGEGAFAFCGRLTEINAAAGSPIYTSVDGILFNKDKTSLIIYPAGKSATTYAVPSGVQTIEENAFYGCANLASVSVPASVSSIKVGNSVIPQWSFEGATPAAIVEGVFANDVYLIVDDVDTYKTAWPAYESRIFPRQYAELDLNLTAKADKSALHMAVGDANLENVIKLTISGTINSYDLMIMRNKMINLRELDLTEASIEASPYEYYTGYCSHADTLLAHSFRGLRSIKLPKTLKYAEYALIDCPDIKYAEFNGGVIGTQVAPYEGNGDLQVVLNEGVTEIQPYAFARTGTSHKFYYYDNDIKSYTNSKLRSISLPNSLGKVETKRFWYCRNLQEVTLGDALTKIEDFAFCECWALTSIVLPEALDTICDFAFQGTNIAEVIIPSGVRRIGNGAFLSIMVSRDYDDYKGTLGSDLVIYYDSPYNEGNIYIYYNNELSVGFLRPRGNTSYYDNTASLRKLTFAPDSKLKEIGVCAFAFCQIDSISMPDSVANIGQYAFVGNHQLKSVKFGENSAVRTIARGLFQNCDALETVVLPAELTKIEELAFSCHNGVDALKEIGIPSKLNAIDRAAFYGRKGLEKISFPTSLQTIGDFAFQGCTGLDEIRVPSTLLSVGDYAFDDCSNVTKVYTYTVEPVNIDQNTFSCWHNADLYVPTTSYYTYFYNTQWSQFLSLKQFDEAYEYFYINNDYELGGDNGTIGGNPNADLNENSGLIITGDSAQQVGTITIAGDANGAASILACEENLVADSLVIRLITQKGIWSYFCFPFDLVLDQLHFAHQYVIREYDGAKRAEYGAGGWVNMEGDMLHKGLGYIFQGAVTDTLVITIPNPKIGCQDYEQIVKFYNAENAIHANWNFIGNPFPSWYDLDVLFEFGFSSPVYIWSTKDQDYKVFKPGDDEYHLHPYEGFFTQNPEGKDIKIKWSSEGRETKTQADNKQKGNNAPYRKAARRARQESAQRKLINIQLASDEYTDRTRVVFNDAARMEYELGKDAVFMEGGQASLHIWSFAPDNSRLSINERPYANGQVDLGYYAREAGFYTLSASRMDTAVIIYDNELNQEVDLSLGEYVFYTDAGTNNTRFTIARVKAHEDQATAIEDVVADPNETVSVYSLLGVKILDNVRRGDINLHSGIYIIENKEGARTELNIK